MPEYRGLTVSVQDKHKGPMKEWGIQKLRGAKQTSCYIEAKTGRQFEVNIHVPVPFHDPDGVASHHLGTRNQPDPKNNPGYFTMLNEFVAYDSEEEAMGGARYSRDESGEFVREHDRRNQNRGYDSDHHHRDRTSPPSRPGHSSDNDCRRSEGNRPTGAGGSGGLGAQHGRRRGYDSYRPDRDDPLRGLGSAPTNSNSNSNSNSKKGYGKVPPPPYHLLASLHIDGRKKAEKSVVVFLDPDDDWFPGGGNYKLQERLVEGRNGRVTSYGWVFQDVGVGRIQSMLDEMLISGSRKADEKVYLRDEDKLISAMNTTALDAESEVQQETAAKGKIEVRLTRIKLGEKFMDRHFHEKHREGQDEDMKMDEDNKDITHETTLKEEGSKKRSGGRLVAIYEPYKNNEGNFAVFTFFYRSQETLMKFGFIGFPQHPVRTRNIKAALTNLTPLSIKENKLARLKRIKGDGTGEKKDSTVEEVEKGERCTATVKHKFEETYRSSPKTSGKENDQRVRCSTSKEAPDAVDVDSSSSNDDTPLMALSSRFKKASTPAASTSTPTPALAPASTAILGLGRLPAVSISATGTPQAPTAPTPSIVVTDTVAHQRMTIPESFDAPVDAPVEEAKPMAAPTGKGSMAEAKAKAKGKSTTTNLGHTNDRFKSYRDTTKRSFASSGDADDEGSEAAAPDGALAGSRRRGRNGSANFQGYKTRQYRRHLATAGVEDEHLLEEGETGEDVDEEPKVQALEHKELTAGLGDLSLRKRKGDGAEQDGKKPKA